jgi:hypothetical protein
MAVAFVALLAALSGTAVALPGTNTVDSGDIKNGQVKNKDIRRNAVTGAKVKNSSLGGADIKNDSLTGLDINESTLGTVPSATAATTANTATTATTANSANTATTANSANTAGNANTVGGRTAESLDDPQAYARVLSDGTVDEDRSKGIADANVTLSGPVRCFDLAFQPRHVQATIEWFGGGLGNLQVNATVNPPNEFCGGEDASAVIVDDDANTFGNAAFYIEFHD